MGCSIFKSSLQTQLKSTTFDSVKPFTPPSGMAKVLDAYDADTCRVALPMNDGTIAKFTLRLQGIDAPERKPSKASKLHDLEKQAALRCRAKFLSMVTDSNISLNFADTTAREICGKSKKLIHVDGTSFDKYGRILATLHNQNGCINDLLLQNGWVRKYDGKTRNPWTKKELEKILKLK